MQALADSPPPELCVIRLSAIGDTCHTVPVVRTIQRAWPHTRVTWIVGKAEHGLLRGMEGVEFLVLDKASGLPGYLHLRRRLGGRRFPLLLNMHPSARATIASLMVSAPLRLGFDRARSRDLHWHVCNRHIPARTHQHVMDSLFGFADALGLERGELRWDIPIPAEDRELASQVCAGDRPIVVISPCAAARFRNYRNWPMECYAEIADYADARYGARVLLTGGSTEEEQRYGQGIMSLCKSKPANLIGRTNLKQLLALLERATAVVCPDSGPAHMATAVRAPVVGLYATTNPSRAGPYLSRELVVDKYPDAVHLAFGKSVDEIRWGSRVRDPEAMKLIKVSDVTEKLDLAFAGRGIAAAG